MAAMERSAAKHELWGVMRGPDLIVVYLLWWQPTLGGGSRWNSVN
jgi:hypothetical protein